MPIEPKNHRRSFLKKLTTSTALAVGAPIAITKASKGYEPSTYLDLVKRKAVAANDKIRVAVIGAGGMGIGDANTALMVDGVEIVAACDLYDGRLVRAKELWGSDIYTTKDYREILERNDVDAIINATTDHWHQKI